MKYKLAFNNAEKEVHELFDTHDEAFACGVDMGGQWVVVEVEEKLFSCEYCGKKTPHNTCEKCGYKEDVALGKIEEIDAL